jgi:DNA mismatch repair protein MutS
MKTIPEPALAYQEEQRQATGISQLKVMHSPSYGLQISIPKAKLKNLEGGLPQSYIPTQTLKNENRYTTEELGNLYRSVSESADKCLERELEIFEAILEDVCHVAPAILHIAAIVSTIDVVAGLANVAVNESYCRPEMVAPEERKLFVMDGRHPVIDQLVTNTVPNDADLDGERDIAILSGPNAAGKSVFLRMIGVAQYLSQVGSFVPAKSATLSVRDRIFTRVGAVDDLQGGQSTFMVEMAECANILNNATEDSLVLLDEVGRGTATEDGLAIATAVCEHLALEVKCKTVFATHFHDLYLGHLKQQLLHLQASAKVAEGSNTALSHPQVEFMYKIVEGKANKSFGIHIARMAGFPTKVSKRAQAIMDSREDGE